MTLKGRSLEITTNIGCSINCKYCPQEVLIREYTKRSNILTLAFEDFITCINKLPKDVRIDFSGLSEPFLNKECLEMMNYAYKKGFSMTVYTTLIGLDMKDIEKLKSLSFVQFVIHLPDNENNAKIIVDEEYCQKLKNILNANLKITDKRIKFHCHGKIHNKINHLVDKKKVNYGIINRAGLLKEVYESKYIKGIISCSACGTSFNQNVFLPSGDVVLCCQDFGMNHILGNLIKQSYLDLFKGECFRKLKKGIVDESIPIICRKCHRVIKK